MKQNHMLGITPAHDNPDYGLMRGLGVRWVRQGYPFPFADEKGTLSEHFLAADKAIERYRAEGFEILCSFTGPGSTRYMPDAGKTVYYRAVPEYLGDPSEDRYHELLFKAAAFLGEYTKDRITWWQIANEPDIDIFYGPLSEKDNIRYLLNAARGIIQGNPKAQCGINLGYINDYARMLMREIYAAPHSPFAYLGIDGYQGSWQIGGPYSGVLTNVPVSAVQFNYLSKKVAALEEAG